jgi:predicted transcriptional regulator
VALQFWLGAMVLSKFSIKKLGESVRSLFRSNEQNSKNLDEIKEQLDDHFHAINETTNEIQSNYEYSLEIESKLSKLAERVDEISLLIGLNPNQKQPEIPKLTTVEKEIFLALYSLCEEKEYATHEEIAKAVNLSKTLIMSYITILIEKGIPIIKSYSDDTIKLRLSSYFKNMQTKNDILKINDDISKQIVLNNFIQRK